MSILAIAAKLVPRVRIITFQLMTNHIHLTVAGTEDDIRKLFNLFRRFLAKYFKANGLVIDLSNFAPNIRVIESLHDLRNVITYNNRNGYVVCPDFTPFSYPWGANAYYFNNMAKARFRDSCGKMYRRERRELIHSHDSDALDPIVTVDGYACPMSFCNISFGESLFRCASHYFREVSRNIEAQKEIAAEIGERIFYTDDELFSIVLSISKQKYGQPKPSLLPVSAKKDLAVLLHNDYKAGNRQIQRMIKLDISVVNALFPERF